jgi:hypothetical protein
MRAVVVLLLLIANAIVSSSNFRTPEPAPPTRTDYSLGPFAVIDGAAPAHGNSEVVATPLCRRNALELQVAVGTATERRHYRCTGEDARAPLLDIRL